MSSLRRPPYRSATAVGACATGTETSASSIPLDRDGFVASQSYPNYPTIDLEALATYSDALVVATATEDDLQLEQSKSVAGTGEGYWIMHDGDLFADRTTGSHRIEVGSTYLLPLVAGPRGWELVDVSEVVPMRPDGSAVLVEPVPEGHSEAPQLLEGFDLDEAVALMERTDLLPGTGHDMPAAARLRATE